MRRALVWVLFVFALGACADESLTLSEYASQAEGIVTVLITSIDALDAEWESQTPSLEGAQAYWTNRLQARADFLEGIQSLDPPNELAEFHAAAVDLFTRLNAAELAMAQYVDTLGTVNEHGQWWDTPEGQTAREVDAESIAICHEAQTDLDATQDEEGFGVAGWLAPEAREAVRIAFGCP